MLCDTLIVALLVHLLLAFPSGRLEGGPTRVTVAAGYVMATVLHAPQRAVGGRCTASADAPGVVDVVAALELRRRARGARSPPSCCWPGGWRAASRVERRGLDPVLLLGAVIVALGGSFLVVQDKRDAARVPVRVRAAAGAFLLGLVRSRFFRTATVGRLIERLAARPGAAGVRDALRDGARRPHARGRLLAAGRRSATSTATAARSSSRRPATGRSRPRSATAGGASARSSTTPALCDEPELLGEAAATAALAIENARLEVELRARLEALRASRARIVEAGDAERRRLGRDLHDGAQQRLVSLMIELQLARERGSDDPAMARELRRPARSPTRARRSTSCATSPPASIRPCSPSAGLDAAIESLATRVAGPGRARDRARRAAARARSRPPPTSSSPRR